MDNQNGVHETLGRLAEAVESLKAGQASLKVSIQNIETVLSEARGGWRILMWLGGSAAAAGLAIGALFDHIAAFFHRGSP